MIQLRQEPSVDQLVVSPELAILALLETAADTAILALAATYPELQDPHPTEESAALRAAVAVIDDARALSLTLDLYRLTLRRASRRDHELPF